MIHFFHALSAYFALPCLAMPVFGLFGIAVLIFWIWSIVEVATKEPSSDQNKIVWILVVVLCGWIGAAIYYFVRRPERIRKYGR